MLADDRTESFAGTWGKSIKQRSSSPLNKRVNDFQTTFTTSFDASKFATLTEENNNKFAKFVSLLELDACQGVFMTSYSALSDATTEDHALEWQRSNGFPEK